MGVTGKKRCRRGSMPVTRATSRERNPIDLTQVRFGQRPGRCLHVRLQLLWLGRAGYDAGDAWPCCQPTEGKLEQRMSARLGERLHCFDDRPVRIVEEAVAVAGTMDG